MIEHTSHHYQKHRQKTDKFYLLNNQRQTRKSWVVWEEDGKYPNVIVEILSNKTATTDRGLKKEIYQDIWRTPDYFWFDPVSLEFKGFHLLDGRLVWYPLTNFTTCQAASVFD